MTYENGVEASSVVTASNTYDLRNQLIQTITSDGKIAVTYYYDAFGNILESTGNVNNSILYSGYQYDKETGLYYLNARMYDPKIARFLQEDTYTGQADDPLSLNLYTYCVNNPIVYWDPTGHRLLSVRETDTGTSKNNNSKVNVFNYEFGKKTVAKGSKGNDVVALQKMLVELEYDIGKCGVDGSFGRDTLKAVKAFQKDHGLEDDGRVGPETKAALLRGDRQVGKAKKTNTQTYKEVYIPGDYNGNGIPDLNEERLKSKSKGTGNITQNAKNYRAVIDSFDVENRKKYLMKVDKNGRKTTYCNYYVKDVMNELGAILPEYVSKSTGELMTKDEIKSGNFYYTTANRLSIWLKDYGEDYGWQQVTASEAQANANQGVPTIATWYNNRKEGTTLDAIPWNHDGKTGHVAIVVPYNPAINIDNANEGVYISQAGIKNYSYNKVESGFNKEKIGQTEYFRYYSYKGGVN